MTKIIKAKFKAKTRIISKTGKFEDLNDCCIIIKVESIILIKKNQTDKLVFVDIKDNVKK